MIPSLLLLLLLESEEAVAEVLLPLPLDVARLVMLAAGPEEELLALLALLARAAGIIFSSIFTSLSSFSVFFSMLWGEEDVRAEGKASAPPVDGGPAVPLRRVVGGGVRCSRYSLDARELLLEELLLMSTCVVSDNS